MAYIFDKQKLKAPLSAMIEDERNSSSYPFLCQNDPMRSQRLCEIFSSSLFVMVRGKNNISVVKSF
jgi:hypothetical protein